MYLCMLGLSGYPAMETDVGRAVMRTPAKGATDASASNNFYLQGCPRGSILRDHPVELSLLVQCGW